ncbi:hydroxyisourate hydrolase [Nocardioides sp.]|uniref:hydroxyisourate hydrolase n=1 Tax=Nocardioides sp. TaxID=35761 RepID=UPI0035170494
MSTLSTHVLDSVLGRPAAGLDVVLEGDGIAVSATTDDDGRVRFAEQLAGGVHRLVFATGAWFDAQGRDHLHPEITVAFTVDDGPDATQEHYHVALLLGPYSYTTYRGS